MIHFLNWALQLEGVSPVARLMAMWMANRATVIGLPETEDPACEIDLYQALAWICCDETEVDPALDELRNKGMSPLVRDGRKIRYTFPDYDVEPWAPKHPKSDPLIWIYVIARETGVSKIGISRLPNYRLSNLQAANPTTKLSIEWLFEGPSSKIRRAERVAHSLLHDQSLGNEWFRATTEEAIVAVKAALEANGLKATR